MITYLLLWLVGLLAVLVFLRAATRKKPPKTQEELDEEFRENHIQSI